MKKTTKQLVTLMLILGVGCILEGCGKESNHSVTITLIHAWGGTEEDHVAMREIYEEFQEENPDINLQMISMPTREDMMRKVEDMIMVGNIPDIVSFSGTGENNTYDFMIENKGLWKNKKVFVIATMGLFSGDGAGVLGRLLQQYGAEIIGGLHLKMPDSIGDEKVLKRPLEKNKELVKKAEQKISKSVQLLKAGKPTQEGIGILYRMAGFFGQRLYFGHKTKNYSDKLRVDEDKCIGCGKCEKLCPMNNIKIVDKKVVQNNRCTMCYRCINNCPKQKKK